MSTSRLLIGIGNLDRGDDGVGRVVARRLCSRNDCAFEVRECGGEAIALMEAWNGFDDVVVVDACRGAGEPGSIHRFGPRDLERLGSLQSLRSRSTHGFGLASALALARALGCLPSDLLIYAIEVGDFAEGGRLSPGVERAAAELVALLVQ